MAQAHLGMAWAFPTSASPVNFTVSPLNMAGEEADYDATEGLQEQQDYANQGVWRSYEEQHEEEMLEGDLLKSKADVNDKDAAPAARGSGDDSAVTTVALVRTVLPKPSVGFPEPRYYRRQFAALITKAGASPPQKGAWSGSGSMKRPISESKRHSVKEEKQEDAATDAASRGRAADAAAGRVWEVECDDGWKPLPDDIQEGLDSIRGTDAPTMTFQRNRKHCYELDTTNMTSKNTQTGAVRELKCRGSRVPTTQSSDIGWTSFQCGLDTDYHGEIRIRGIGPDCADGPVPSSDIDRVWEVEGDDDEGWFALPDKVQMKLDNAHGSDWTVTYKRNARHVYVLDTKAMTSQNKNTMKVRQLRRREIAKKQDSSNATSSGWGEWS